MAVSTTTAMLELKPTPPSASLASSPMPSRRGIFKSVTTMAGSHASAFSHASTPSRAVSVRYPHPEISSASPASALGSSSAINTFTAFCIGASAQSLAYLFARGTG